MNRADESSEELMARVARGSDAALSALIRRHASPLLAFLQWIGNSDALVRRLPKPSDQAAPMASYTLP